MLLSKFRGCFIGSLLGDCLGAPFEGEDNVSKVVLQKYLDTMEDLTFKPPIKMYTDDTSMTRCIAKSLWSKKTFDEVDLVKRFTDEYYKNTRRGYGGNVIEVFAKWKKSNFIDVWKPGKEQFGGSGSYGNGGAMRISPVALFYHDNYEKMIEVAKLTTELTHTNELGINGAILQCLAINKCLKLDPSEEFNTNSFVDTLITDIEKFESSYKDQREENASYKDQLNLMKNLLNTDEKKLNCSLEETIIKTLGNSISAIYSVPTAIYCFLRAQKPISDVKTDNPFRRSIQFAISLGGDTDTIASMTGAIAGAYYGDKVIDERYFKYCEGVNEQIQLAEDIYDAIKFV